MPIITKTVHLEPNGKGRTERVAFHVDSLETKRQLDDLVGDEMTRQTYLLTLVTLALQERWIFKRTVTLAETA